MHCDSSILRVLSFDSYGDRSGNVEIPVCGRIATLHRPYRRLQVARFMPAAIRKMSAFDSASQSPKLPIRRSPSGGAWVQTSVCSTISSTSSAPMPRDTIEAKGNVAERSIHCRAGFIHARCQSAARPAAAPAPRRLRASLHRGSIGKPVATTAPMHSSTHGSYARTSHSGPR